MDENTIGQDSSPAIQPNVDGDTAPVAVAEVEAVVETPAADEPVAVEVEVDGPTQEEAEVLATEDAEVAVEETVDAPEAVDPDAE